MAEVAKLGSSIPDFPYHGRLQRWIARQVGRRILHLAGLHHQRVVNAAPVGLVSAPLPRTEAQALALAQLRMEALEARLRAIDAELLATRATANAAPGPEHVVPATEAYLHQCAAEFESFRASGGLLTFRRPTAPRISIVIVLFGRPELGYACLQSLPLGGVEDFEVVLVDNGPAAESDLLLERVAGATVLRNAENLGFVAAVNQGARLATGDVLLLLNNDARLHPGAISAALDVLARRADVGAVGGRLLSMDGTLLEAGSIVWRDGLVNGYGRGEDTDRGEYRFARPVDFCSAAFLATPRRLFLALEGFDSTFSPGYFEDVDYCLRLAEKGLQVMYAPGAAVWHLENAGTTLAQKSDLMRRNRERLLAKHRAGLAGRRVRDPAALLAVRASPAPEHRLLFIDNRAPDPVFGAGFGRAREMIAALVDLGWFVTVFTTEPSRMDWTRAASVLPEGTELIGDRQRKGLARFLKERRGYYDVVLVSRQPNMKLWLTLRDEAPDLLGSAALVYDMECSPTSRTVREAQVGGHRVDHDAAARAVAHEVELARAAHVVIVVSEVERQALASRGVEEPILFRHVVHPRPTSPGFGSRRDLLFVGAFHGPGGPNYDSMVWFVGEVMPIIDRLSGGRVRLTIAGHGASDVVGRLAGPTVRIPGRVKDLTPLYDSSRVFVAPTRFAAGIPIKVYETAAQGVPVVASSLLAHQLGWNDGRSLSVPPNESAEALARACMALYVDEDRWVAQRTAALARVAEECSARAARGALDAALARATRVAATSQSSPRRGAGRPWRRVFFLHIPKTAGSSLRVFLESLVGRENTLYNDRLKAWRFGAERSEREVLEKLRGYPLIHSHFFTLAEAMAADPEGLYMTMWRDPARQLLSTYDYLRSLTQAHIEREPAEHRTQIYLAQSGSFETFLEGAVECGFADGHSIRLVPDILARRTRDFPGAVAACRQALEKLHFGGITEQFRRSLMLLAATIDVPWSDRFEHRINVTAENPRLDATLFRAIEPTELTPERRARAEAASPVDAAVYPFAVELFERHCATLGIAADRP